MNLRRLNHEQVLSLHQAAITARLAASRSGLLAGLPASFVASFPQATSLGEQVLADIDAINAVGILIDGTIPLVIWLKNAIRLAGSRQETTTFVAALDLLAGINSAMEERTDPDHSMVAGSTTDMSGPFGVGALPPPDGESMPDVDYDVLILYVQEDAAWAHQISRVLARRGFRPQLACDNPAFSQNWQLEIHRAISASVIFLACLTNRSVDSRGHPRAELDRVMQILTGVPVHAVVLRADNCTIPTRFQHLHIIDCFDEGASSKILSHLSLLLRRARRATPTRYEETVRFVSVQIHPEDCNWAELPRRANHSPFGDEARYFELIEFVYDGHPTFDLTLLNTSGSPAVLTQLGFQILHACTVDYSYGFPQPSKIPVMDTYQLVVPALRSQFERTVSRDVNRLVLLRLSDPIYIPNDGPYRCSLRLVDYVRNAPNHSIIRFWGETSKGAAWSEALETFTL